MVITCVTDEAHFNQIQDCLTAIHVEPVSERISNHETLLTIRVNGEAEAQYLSDVLNQAGSSEVTVDLEAA